jgi:hypothetical protein
MEEYRHVITIQPEVELTKPSESTIEISEIPQIPVPALPSGMSGPSLTSSSMQSSRNTDSPTAIAVRGGPYHRSIQQQIKQIAEAYGFKAETEKMTENKGLIDVALKKETITIACEISVTTSAAWEAKNVQKCLEAGYDHVFVIVSPPKSIPDYTTKILAVIPVIEHVKIRVLKLADFFIALKQIGSPTDANSGKPAKLQARG